MTIAIDKDSLDAIDNENEFIYIFKDEQYNKLIDLGIRCVSYEKLDNLFVDINLTNYNIECLKKANSNDKNWKEMPQKKNHKIAIIIPNFNYAEHLEKCLTSLLNQTYQNFEIIFVDDVSTDNSVEIAKKILKSPHKIIQLKQKRLNGGARNEAYLHVSDDVDYIWYVDSDDWVADNRVLEDINNKLYSKPDVLFLGMAWCKKGNIKPCFAPTYKNKYEAFEGWSGSCGKVIKKELATRQECLYSEGTLKEDRNQHRRICIYMNSFKLYTRPVYIWNRDNSKSVTTIRDKKIWGTHTIRQYADTLQLYLTEKGKDERFDNMLWDCVKKTRDEMMNGGDKQY